MNRHERRAESKRRGLPREIRRAARQVLKRHERPYGRIETDVVVQSIRRELRAREGG